MFQKVNADFTSALHESLQENYRITWSPRGINNITYSGLSPDYHILQRYPIHSPYRTIQASWHPVGTLHKYYRDVTEPRVCSLTPLSNKSEIINEHDNEHKHNQRGGIRSPQAERLKQLTVALRWEYHRNTKVSTTRDKRHSEAKRHGTIETAHNMTNMCKISWEQQKHD